MLPSALPREVNHHSDDNMMIFIDFYLLWLVELLLETNGGATFSSGNKAWYVLYKIRMTLDCIIVLTIFSIISSSGENRYFGVSATVIMPQSGTVNIWAGSFVLWLMSLY